MGREGAPVLGDEVYIGTGATLVGKIKIGSGAKIAANTLVMSNIPCGSDGDGCAWAHHHAAA